MPVKKFILLHACYSAWNTHRDIYQPFHMYLLCIPLKACLISSSGSASGSAATGEDSGSQAGGGCVFYCSRAHSRQGGPLRAWGGYCRGWLGWHGVTVSPASALAHNLACTRVLSLQMRSNLYFRALFSCNRRWHAKC